MAKTVAEQVASLKLIRDGYLTALETDSGAPQPDENFDGQQVEYVKWRRQLLQDIKDIQEQICLLEPFEFTTVQP